MNTPFLTNLLEEGMCWEHKNVTLKYTLRTAEMTVLSIDLLISRSISMNKVQ